MSGKALLILVIGFTIIFMVMGYFWGNIAKQSTENHVSYYKTTVAHDIAVSGANIGLEKVLADSQWVSDINSRPFEDGFMTVSLTALGPPQRTLKSIGTFMGETQIVKVKLMRDQTSLAKYAWFIPGNSTGSVPNRPWITGDTIWGRFHSNQYLVVDGDPVYYGKVTTLKGIKDMGVNSDPKFYGGYEEGIDVNWTKSMHYPNYQTIAGAGASFTKDLWLVFHDNGTVTYRIRTSSGGINPGQDSTKYGPPTTVSLSTLAPNGVIYDKGSDIHISGTLSGKVTIVSEGSSGGGSGNIYLEGDMIYKTDPMIPNGEGGYMINPASVDGDGNPNDLLGIIATNNILVSTSGNLGGYQNNVVNHDIHIDGGVFCNSGGFKVQGLGSSPANVPLGSIYLQGSMTAGKEEVVAQFSNNTLTAGYNRNVIFDERLAIGPPIWFPWLDYYRAISWLE